MLYLSIFQAKKYLQKQGFGSSFGGREDLPVTVCRSPDSFVSLMSVTEWSSNKSSDARLSTSIILSSGSFPRSTFPGTLDFPVTVNWQKHHILLKFAFRDRRDITDIAQGETQQFSSVLEQVKTVRVTQNWWISSFVINLFSICDLSYSLQDRSFLRQTPISAF